MSAIPTQRYIAPDEYFSIERDTDYRNEYYAGKIVELLGDSWEHATRAFPSNPR